MLPHGGSPPSEGSHVWHAMCGSYDSTVPGAEACSDRTFFNQEYAFVLRRKPALQRYELLVRFWRADWSAFFEVLRLGWPIGAMVLAEVGLFAGAAILAGAFVLLLAL